MKDLGLGQEDMKQESVTKTYKFDSIESQLTEAESGRRALFFDNKFIELVACRLNQLLSDESVLSVDIFDTLLWRDNSSELTRFYEVGALMAELASSHSRRTVTQVDAFWARHLGTLATYRASKRIQGCREGSLREIHATASRILVRNDALCLPFIEAELQYELKRLEPNPFLVKYLAAHRRRGGRVVLLTDTYMHAEHVDKLLNSLGISRNNYDYLISSADTKVSKASGKIFRLVEELVGAKANDFVHIGDNFLCDYAQPIRNGWRALHLPIAQQDIILRRQDHLATAKMLREKYGVNIDIALPK